MILSNVGAGVIHEGLRDHTSFESFADELDERLASGPAGDASPGMEVHLDAILARWPGARFVVIGREADDGLEAFVRALPEEYREGARHSWPVMMTTFKAACDTLRDGAYFAQVHELADNQTLLELVEFATGKRMSELWAKRMQRMKVTSIVDPSECVVPPPPRKVAQPTNLVAGLDTTGLEAALYRDCDFPMVRQWWRSHNKVEDLQQLALPPLGVVVSKDGKPVAAMFCYESYGVAAAELVFPVTAPGLTVKQASTAILYAATCLINMAGKCVKPEGHFQFFKVLAPVATARYLERVGFQPMRTPRTPLTLTLNG